MLSMPHPSIWKIHAGFACTCWTKPSGLGRIMPFCCWPTADVPNKHFGPNDAAVDQKKPAWLMMFQLPKYRDQDKHYQPSKTIWLAWYWADKLSGWKHLRRKILCLLWISWPPVHCILYEGKEEKSLKTKKLQEQRCHLPIIAQTLLGTSRTQHQIQKWRVGLDIVKQSASLALGANQNARPACVWCYKNLEGHDWRSDVLIDVCRKQLRQSNPLRYDYLPVGINALETTGGYCTWIIAIV